MRKTIKTTVRNIRSSPNRRVGQNLRGTNSICLLMLMVFLSMFGGNQATASEADVVGALVVSQVRTRDPVVFITIDDGSYTSKRLADLLDKRKIPVTNFVLPESLWKQRKWFQARLNMTFENHTNTHASMTRLNLEAQTEEICHASKIIRQISKSEPVFFRPPGGGWNDDTRRAAAACGIDFLVTWTATADQGKIQRSGGGRLQAGDIILMHYLSSLPDSLTKLLLELRQLKLKPALLRNYLGN